MKNDDKKQNNTIDDKKNKANKAKTLTINQEKIALLKRKFTFIRKIRPLKLQKNDSKEKIKFDKKTAENIYEVDLVSI